MIMIRGHAETAPKLLDHANERDEVEIEVDVRGKLRHAGRTRAGISIFDSRFGLC